MPNLSGRQFSGPQYEQLSLPGAGRGTEQMRLFDTHRAGPANVYATNPSLDASDWRDEDREVPLSEEGMELIADDEHEISGEFFNFPVGESHREFMAYGGAHQEEIGRTREAGTHLGHDAYPERINPNLRFEDLFEDGMNYDEREWYTDDETMVGKISYHEDDWGPNVDYAEINPLYRGRGFSRDALTKVAGGLEPGEGIMHAGSFTSAGHGAFQAKGIPTEDDLESGYEDFYEQEREAALDPYTVRERAAEIYPDEDSSFWDSDDSEFYLDDARSELMQEFEHGDDDRRSMFRQNLEEMQAQVLGSLPGGGRKSSFAQGWKPKSPTRGFNEELPGMPQKYTGAFEG